MIPHGLPGAGNVLLLDNGGMAGYGDSSPSCLNGAYNACRHYSRVLEINPVTLDIVWSYNDCREFHQSALSRFFSAIRSGMRRLPDGHTLTCESTSGRVFEVTVEGEIVGEYVDPAGCLFRALPLRLGAAGAAWEKAVEPPVNRSLRVENCAAAPDDDADFCSDKPRHLDAIVSALPPRGGFGSKEKRRGARGSRLVVFSAAPQERAALPVRRKAGFGRRWLRLHRGTLRFPRFRFA